MKPTQGRKPRTGEAKLRLLFRNGQESRWTYTTDQIRRWTHTGCDWDIIAVERAR